MDMEAKKCDVLVVGAGLAGLRAAYDCAVAGMNTVLLTKNSLCGGASFYPLTGGLGAQLPLDESDKKEYLNELLDTGAGIADEALCRIMVEEIEAEVERLPQLGIVSEEFGGRASCFAKKERKLRRWSGWAEIRKNAREILGKIPSLCIAEHSDLYKVIVRENRVQGAVLADDKGVAQYLSCKAIVLATGGYCGLYRHSLNTQDVCGIGHSIALDAGAELINLEFMQFIPGLIKPVYKLLFGEVSLWHCNEMLSPDGQQILKEYLPDSVTMEECFSARAMHGPFTSADDSKYFDLSIMDYAQRTGSEQGAELFYSPKIDKDENGFVKHIRELYQEYGIDLAKQSISVAPFAHCANGGIRINENCETGVEGLFAAGEAAGGVHGADRHGGAATSCCLVFGKRAAAQASAYAAEHTWGSVLPEEALLEWKHWISGGSGCTNTPQEILESLGGKLWFHANVLRSKDGLQEVLSWAKKQRAAYDANAAIRAGSDPKIAMQTFHALRTAEALISAMLLRQESRGSHYRSDFPTPNPALYGKRFVLSEKKGELYSNNI